MTYCCLDNRCQLTRNPKNDVIQRILSNGKAIELFLKLLSASGHVAMKMSKGGALMNSGPTPVALLFAVLS